MNTRSNNCDVLVAGGGNAALCAAVSAAEAGAEVQLLEAAPRHFRGGNWGVWFEAPGTIDVRDNDFSAATQGPTSGGYSATSVAETTPPTPTWTTSGPGPTPGSVTLQWAFAVTQFETHDSFYIEYAPAETGRWTRLAYRPGNNPIWRFVAPTNVRWVAYDPLAYTARGLTSGQSYDFRIRANNGSKISGWSSTASAVAK